MYTLCKVCCTNTGQSAEKMSTLCKVCCTPCWVQIKMSTHIARCDTLAVHHAEYRKISSLCKEYPTVQSRKKCAASAKNIQPCTAQKKCLPIARCAVRRVEYRKNVPQLQGVLFTVQSTEKMFPYCKVCCTPCRVQKKCPPIARCAVHRVEYRKNVQPLARISPLFPI